MSIEIRDEEIILAGFSFELQVRKTGKLADRSAPTDVSWKSHSGWPYGPASRISPIVMFVDH
jgi:hypothetical protein